MKDILDLRKTQYTDFITLYASTGLKWTSYLVTASHSSNFLNLIPLTYNLSILLSQTDALRINLRESFPLFIDDLVEVKIFNKDKVLFLNQNYLGKVNVFSAQIENWKKDFIQVQVQIILLEKGEQRIKSEELSRIFKSEEYLSSLKFEQSALEKIKNIETDELKKKREQINLSLLNFKKIISYERFLQFLPLSKYSNEHLINLDKDWGFDELEVSKLNDSLRLFRSNV